MLEGARAQPASWPGPQTWRPAFSFSLWGDAGASMRFLLVGLFLVGCFSPAPEARVGGSDCVTSCGARVLGAYDTCGQVEKTQEIVLAALDGLYPTAQACGALEGVEVRVTGIPIGEFELDGETSYGGYREDGAGLIVLPETAWLGYSMLPHELIHLFDHELAGFDDPGHQTFDARGVDERNASVWDEMKRLVGSGEMYRLQDAEGGR
jgi:hypothetical protein